MSLFALYYCLKLCLSVCKVISSIIGNTRRFISYAFPFPDRNVGGIAGITGSREDRKAGTTGDPESWNGQKTNYDRKSERMEKSEQPI
jgi:hypothetical protein